MLLRAVRQRAGADAATLQAPALLPGAVALTVFNRRTPPPGSPGACEWEAWPGVQANSHVVRITGVKGAKYNFTR